MSVCHYAISELCKGLCTITTESGTSPRVLRFTGFDHRRERRHLEYDYEVSGSGVSEGVSEAPTFMEWCTMVVPTYPEGGSHALQVCQHHHQVVRVGDCVRLSEIGGTRCSRLLRSIRG